MTEKDIHYGVIRNAEELGALVRAHRKRQGLPLEKVSGVANLGTRFLSEFERGKATAEIGKVLKALHTLGLVVEVKPRTAHARVNVQAAASTRGTGSVDKKSGDP